MYDIAEKRNQMWQVANQSAGQMIFCIPYLLNGLILWQARLRN